MQHRNTGIGITSFYRRSDTNGRNHCLLQRQNTNDTAAKKTKKRLLHYAESHNILSGLIFITKNGKPIKPQQYLESDEKKLCNTAKVKSSKVFPHNLRKLFARTFYGMEKDIAGLADILGHSNVNTTRIYIMSTGTEHRRKLERLGLVV